MLRSNLICMGLLGVMVVLQAEEKSSQGIRWVDYHDLTEKERLRERPGNFGFLSGIATFLEGIYAIRPRVNSCAFPLQMDSKTYRSMEDYNQYQKKRAAARGQGRNKLRSYNLQMRSLHAYDPDQVLTTPALQKKIGWREFTVSRLKEVRKRHPGRAVLVLANLELESLQSPKVEGSGGEEIVFYLVHTKGDWKVAWFDK